METQQTELQILAALAGNINNNLSIAELSAAFNIDEDTFREICFKMKERGYELYLHRDSVRLSAISDVLDETMLRFMFGYYDCDFNVVFKKITDSTITDAKLLLGEDFSGIIVAERQTGGKGRKGRVFCSGLGGAYFSVVKDVKQFETNQLLKFVMLAGVAVCQSLEELGFQPSLKWPNDVFLGNKKVCGILCEMVLDSDGGKKLIMGMGINVNTETFPPEACDKATSMRLFSGNEYVRAEVIASVAANVERLAGVDIADEYRKRSNTIGREVFIEENGARYRAFARDIDADGFLMIECAEGVKRLVTGDVSVRFQ